MAQPVGVQKVEVSIDNGEWQETQLSTPINDQSWVQWNVRLDRRGRDALHRVRATDKQGNLQIQAAAPIAPNGSSGGSGRCVVTVSS